MYMCLLPIFWTILAEVGDIAKQLYTTEHIYGLYTIKICPVNASLGEEIVELLCSKIEHLYTTRTTYSAAWIYGSQEGLGVLQYVYIET